MSVKKTITLINDYSAIQYEEYYPYYGYANVIKNGLSLRGISIQPTDGGHYYNGMVWGGDLKASDVLMLLHSYISSSSGEIQSIVKWARDNKKKLIIVTLDDTPLTCAWELVLADYKQYQIIKYNEVDPNETIFKIEKKIKDIEHIEKIVSIKRKFHFPIFICVGLIALAFAIFGWEEGDSIDIGIIVLIFIATLCSVCSVWHDLMKFSKIYRKQDNSQQDRILKTEDKKNTQSISTDKKMIEYKCFIAGATTITEERDAVRASLSQVENRWGALDIMLSSYTFEDFDNNHQQQVRYDEFIQNEADCVIVIIADGIGPKTIGEYRLAVSTLQKTKKRPKVVVYADEKSKNDPNVVEFKKEVENNKTYWVSYTSLNELKEKIQNEMTKQLLPIVQRTIKKS